MARVIDTMSVMDRRVLAVVSTVSTGRFAPFLPIGQKIYARTRINLACSSTTVVWAERRYEEPASTLTFRGTLPLTRGE
jgi:hypothetical protein